MSADRTGPLELRPWLARGMELEAALQRHAVDYEAQAQLEGTTAALRAVMSAWINDRSLIGASCRTADLLRELSKWTSDAFLVDAAHWALGPYRWCAP